jgi:hypothetical protein
MHTWAVAVFIILVYYLRNLFTGYPWNAAHITALIPHHTQDHPTGEDMAVWSFCEIAFVTDYITINNLHA